MKKIKGTLILIGGAEDKGKTAAIKDREHSFEEFEILREFLPNEPTKKDFVEIITTASQQPLEVEKMYHHAFKKLGFENVRFMHITRREEASDEEYLKRCEESRGVFFSGGDQFRLSTILSGTPLISCIRKKYEEDKEFVVAGTSAGAMAMTEVMLYESERNEAMLKGTARLLGGFGFINHCIVDTHFIRRGRFGRLTESVVMSPSCIGIGLGEDTALVITGGEKAVCRGSGMVVIIDGQTIGHTNILDAQEGDPICIENLTVHILVRNSGYNLCSREFVPSKKELEEQVTRR